MRFIKKMEKKKTKYLVIFLLIVGSCQNVHTSSKQFICKFSKCQVLREVMKDTLVYKCWHDKNFIVRGKRCREMQGYVLDDRLADIIFKDSAMRGMHLSCVLGNLGKPDIRTNKKSIDDNEVLGYYIDTCLKYELIGDSLNILGTEPCQFYHLYFKNDTVRYMRITHQ